MAHTNFRAKSLVRNFELCVNDCRPIDDYFDESRSYMCDVRHRALRHHHEGIFLREKLFGVSITNSDGREVPVRIIGEQYVVEDLGRIPSLSEWLRELTIKTWMGPRSRLELTIECIDQEAEPSRNWK